MTVVWAFAVVAIVSWTVCGFACYMEARRVNGTPPSWPFFVVLYSLLGPAAWAIFPPDEWRSP